MVFSSTIFLFLFLPITLMGYFLLKECYRNYWLLFASLIFFSWEQPQYLWIILLNVFVNYISAICMRKDKYKKVILFLCLSVNIGLLIYFKYFNFLLETFKSVTGTRIELFDIVLPIGISFFTFQGIAYVVDVYRNNALVQRNPFKVALYIVLFPQLIAGPIVRYTDIAEKIDDRKISLADFTYGIERFIIGLSKKVIIANTMAGIADSVWSRDPSSNMMSVAWLGSIAYTLQIYYDFSGYSDMAIGLGRMFGFRFNENFNLPYVSRSITEFWRRWHISLSSWFRDYVYIPLGGNRYGNVYVNLGIVFLLTGIWHGASWNFVVWGIWNGIFIIIEKLLNKNNIILKNNILGLLYTLFIVNMGWVLFRANTLSDAYTYMCSMFDNNTSNAFTISYYLNAWNICIGIIALFASSTIPQKIKCKVLTKGLSKRNLECIKYIGLLFVLFVSITRVVSGTYNPFIYFQF